MRVLFLKTGLSLTLDRDKEHPMELNFECILERIEFSQFQQHSTLPPGGRVTAEKTSKV